MSQRWGDNKADRTALDKWLTNLPEDFLEFGKITCQACGGHLFVADVDEETGEPILSHLDETGCDDPTLPEEVDPVCNLCDLPYSDHECVQVTDEEGNDYETYRCPLNQDLPGTVPGGNTNRTKEGS
jgi:hypothetical protein